MAVFTAIASAIIAGFSSTLTFGAVFAAAGSLTALGIGTSLLAGGIALATAKATGVFKPAGVQQSKDPGVKVQLQPSTDNRVPVFYGNVHTGAIAVDAGIANKNNTMIYVMVIGEKTDSGTYTVNSIKRNDAKLNFSGPTVISMTDPNATSSTNVNGKMRCRVYAGGTASSNQIFPLTPKVAATSLLNTITASTNYANLVYAVFEMDYDPENNLQQLGQITFNINNSLNEPSNVMLDYLQNDRYGAGLSSSDLELSGFNDLYDYSTEQVNYLTTANVSTPHNRWQIDGMLSTYQSVKDNIDKLAQSCSTFFTYNPKVGKFTVVPNRAATTAEKANAFVFSDDNIVGKIGISGTELYSLYNSIEAEYPSVIKEDQTNTVIVSTPSGERNTNEPDNELQTRYDLVNDAPRVANLANIDLRQSRVSTLLEFEATYEGIQVNVGDVVKVTSELYGYTNKLFRCMRTTEVEKADGMLLCKVILLEYDDSVYTHTEVTSDGVVGIPGIPSWWTGWGNTNIDWANILGNINVVTSPTANANVVDPGNGNVIANVDYANIDLNLPDFSLGGFTPGFNFKLDYANMINANNIIGGADQVVVSVANEDLPNSNPTTHIIEPTVDEGFGGMFNPESFIDINIPLPDLGVDFSPGSAGTKGFPTLSNTAPAANVNVSVQLKNQQVGTATPFYNIPANISFAPDGGIQSTDIRDVGSGFQVEDTPASNLAMANSDIVSAPLGDANTLINIPDAIDLGGIEAGDYFFDTAVQFGGTIPSGGANLAFQSRATKVYQEKYAANLANVVGNTVVVTDEFEGVIVTGATDVGALRGASKGKTDIDPAEGLAGATSLGWDTTNKVYAPAELYIYNYANTNMSNTVGDRSVFGITNTGGRQFKGDRYIPIK